MADQLQDGVEQQGLRLQSFGAGPRRREEIEDTQKKLLPPHPSEWLWLHTYSHTVQQNRVFFIC